VVTGDGRGRTIGCPTANLEALDQLIPGDGVYAGQTKLDGRTYACAINVGPAPTFETAQRRVEAHLLDFGGDLYGRTLRLAFVDFLRGQQRFASADALKAQLRTDIAAVRERTKEDAQP
jgi:riboflavin kinase/FMN adenylyltransferase